nr:MAG TPA: hypothetical protein [Bacteriophage sp.]
MALSLPPFFKNFTYMFKIPPLGQSYKTLNGGV